MFVKQRPKVRKRARRPSNRAGQSLIEFALASAFLMLLVAAAVDVGLAYRAYQTLVNASASASSYLAQYPYDGTPTKTITGANNKALNAFRNEQSGGTSTIGGSTFDLNANGTNDASEFGATYGLTASSGWTTWFRIDEASDAEVAANATNAFNGYTGTTDSKCRDRYQFDASSTSANKKPCYIVIRAKLIYHPFFLSPVFGQSMTITSVTTKPIVGLPSS
jgi:Flp pilus assembly protein TadG